METATCACACRRRTRAPCGLCGELQQEPQRRPERGGGEARPLASGRRRGLRRECVPGPCPNALHAGAAGALRRALTPARISSPEGPLAPCHSLIPPGAVLPGLLADACQAQAIQEASAPPWPPMWQPARPLGLSSASGGGLTSVVSSDPRGHIVGSLLLPSSLITPVDSLSYL